MSRDLILHIGINKTGSTAIQKVMALRRREILAQGMSYPRTPGYEKHVLLATAAATRSEKDNARIWKFSSPEVKLDKFRSEFDAEMKALPDSVRRIILSAEQFSFVLKDIKGIENLRDLVAPYADDIKVVVYLRRPDQHLTSLYSEMIRWGDARAPGLAGLRLPAGHGYDFDRMLDRWATVFGEQAIKPQIFERRPGEKFDVIEHFLGICGLKIKIPAKKTANEALSLPAQLVLVELARRIQGGGRHFNVSSEMWRLLVESAAAVLPGKGWQPTRAEAEAFNERYAENHERVRARWFPERPTLFSTDYSELPVESPRLETAALLDATMRVILELGERAIGLEDKLAAAVLPTAEQEGNNRRMQRNLAKRIQLFPDNIEARVKLARLLAAEGDLQAAQKLVEAALKISPNNAEASALSVDLAARESVDMDDEAVEAAVA
jgi:hypothetical protein